MWAARYVVHAAVCKARVVCVSSRAYVTQRQHQWSTTSVEYIAAPVSGGLGAVLSDYVVAVMPRLQCIGY